MEKTFAINEQFTFPGGKPKPSQLVTQCVSFAMGETQLIGTKVIVKGTVNITLCYLSNEVNYPVRAEFSTPFSQIIDTGEEQMEHCSAVIELTSCYCDIIDTINGEKALDAEIHAVLQLVCHSRQSVSYISDVYSNLMPAEFTAQTRQLGTSSAVQQVKLAADERVNVVEDCADVLSVFSSVSQVSVLPDKMSAAVTLDVIYRTTGGTLSDRAAARQRGEHRRGSADKACPRAAVGCVSPSGRTEYRCAHKRRGELSALIDSGDKPRGGRHARR